jgi:hypothetical protein
VVKTPHFIASCRQINTPAVLLLFAVLMKTATCEFGTSYALGLKRVRQKWHRIFVGLYFYREVNRSTSEKVFIYRKNLKYIIILISDKGKTREIWRRKATGSEFSGQPGCRRECSLKLLPFLEFCTTERSPFGND